MYKYSTHLHLVIRSLKLSMYTSLIIILLKEYDSLNKFVFLFLECALIFT
jgi:hypothetical protein